MGIETEVLQAEAPLGANTGREANAGQLSRRAIANMCFGLFGVQIVWGLQNVDTSRIFQTLGASLDELPILWIAAPITGLLVQPIIGHLSDRTWGPLGRRRPYLLGGAIVSSVALVIMPNVSTLWAATLMLWLLTAATNVAMEPFRALVADSVPEDQRTAAFAMQVVFIGTGAVVASILPWLLTHLGVAAVSRPGVLPPSLRVSFAIGAVALVASVGTTVATTSERPPGQLIGQRRHVERPEWTSSSSASLMRHGTLSLLAGIVIAFMTAIDGYRSELYLIAGLGIVLGAGQWATAWSARHGVRPTGLLEIIDDVVHMPPVLRRLGVVQFFTWFGLFAMWIYIVPAVAAHNGEPGVAGDLAYNRSADWVGVMFALYNLIAALGAFILPTVVRCIGRRQTHSVFLLFGAAGLLGFAVIVNPNWLWVAAIAMGCAWASILSIPYAMVSSAVPPSRMGVYMGIHNVFLVLPQLVATALLGWIVDKLFGHRAELALILAAVSFIVAALLSLTIPDHHRD